MTRITPTRVATLPVVCCTGVMTYTAKDRSHPLDDARAFAASVLWAPDEYLDTIALACAVSHGMDAWRTVPRLLFTSPEGQSGKTTALDIVTMLSANPWLADSTSYALRAKFNEPVRPTLMVDEISTIFGQSGRSGGNNQLGRILREGYRKSAKLSSASQQVAQDTSSFCLAAFGGLKTAVPGDIRTRCIVFTMKPKPGGVATADSQDEATEAIGAVYRNALRNWVRQNTDELKVAVRNLAVPHSKFADRRRQIWESLFAVAEIAGGDWSQRCLTAFKALALDASDLPVLTPEEMIIRDSAEIVAHATIPFIPAADLRDGLRTTEGNELYDALSDRRLALLMASALGTARTVRFPDGLKKAFGVADIQAQWLLLSNAIDGAAEVFEETEDPFDVTDVTEADIEQFDAYNA